MTASPERLSSSRMHGGRVETLGHASAVCACDMQLSVFVPPQATQGSVPALYWLSGLTCSDENFTLKAGAQRYAAEHGLMLVACDTSPRGEGVADDPDGDWDLGLGAGFYVNATQLPWSTHYRMYDYVVEELPELIDAHYPTDPRRRSIFGHSMGGHGALVVALRNPGRYRSVSALAPICSPTRCAWGQKAFSNYLGADPATWEAYDACRLIERGGCDFELLVDQGDADGFMADQLRPELLREACEKAGVELTLRIQPGYDHSYFFIASFMEDHLAFHARQLSR
jgi:S-formylglutathione hydrolase